jgi:hypothetical protein
MTVNNKPLAQVFDDLLDDMTSFISFGEHPSSRELKMLDALDMDPNQSIETLMAMYPGWPAINIDRVKAYQQHKQQHAQAS